MDIEKLDSWYSLLRAIPAATLLIIVAQFLGGQFLQRLNWQTAAPRISSTEFHFTGLVGINLLGLLALPLGWAPLWLRGIVLSILALVSIAWIVSQLAQALKRNQTTKQGKSRASTSRPWYQLLLAVALLFTLGPALAYPAGWDELTYHLELPRRWHSVQALSVFFDLPYSSLPSLPEAVWTLSYPIESLITPRLFVWIVWVQGICLFYAACARVSRPNNALCLTVAMAASPMALMISATCYVEALIWANVACALWLCVLPVEELNHNSKRVWLLGLFIGGSIAIKMTSVGLLCLPLLLTATRRSFTWRQSALAIACALAFAFPFYLRAWWQTGNPVSPYYAHLFTTDAATLECSRYHHALAVSNFGLPGALGICVGPVTLAMANELYDGTLGWQWLLMLLLLATAIVHAWKARRPESSLVWLCVIAAALFYGLWFVTSQQVRFAVPLFMVVILAAAIGIESYKPSMQRWWRCALIAIAVIGMPWNNFGYYLDSWLCVLKVRTPLDYIRDGITDSYAELSLALQERLPSDAKVISLFEHRLIYLPPQVEIATPFFQTKYFRDPLQESATSLMSELNSHSIDYVILTTNPVGPDISPAHIERQKVWFQNIDKCIADGHLKVVWKSDHHGLVEVVKPLAVGR